MCDSVHLYYDANWSDQLKDASLLNIHFSDFLTRRLNTGLQDFSISIVINLMAFNLVDGSGLVKFYSLRLCCVFSV